VLQHNKLSFEFALLGTWRKYTGTNYPFDNTNDALNKHIR